MKKNLDVIENGAGIEGPIVESGLRESVGAVGQGTALMGIDRPGNAVGGVRYQGTKREKAQKSRFSGNATQVITGPGI